LNVYGPPGRAILIVEVNSDPFFTLQVVIMMSAQKELRKKMQRQVMTVLRDCPAVWTTGRLVVGVSGGPDSLALLHLLHHAVLPQFRRDGRSLHIVAAHLNHQLRPEAGTEADYVQHLCREWGVSCYVDIVDVPALAAQPSGSLEEIARKVRYRFLAQVAAEVDAHAVAVAHHADDQVETVLMHFLRGAGPAGLRGMRPVSPLPGASHLALVRPLLAVTRKEIEAYCAAQNLTPIRDRSNLDTTYFRNRLRHELLPLLETYNPQIRRRLQNSAEVWAADVELLDDLRDKVWKEIVVATEPGWLRFHLATWQALPLGLRRSTLRYAVWTLHQSLRDVGFLPIEQARECLDKGLVGSQVTLPGGLILTVEYATWTLALPGRSVPSPVEAPQIHEKTPLSVPGRIALNPPWHITATWVEHISLAEVVAQQNSWAVYLHPTCRNGLHVRPRVAGERFQPLGLHGHSTKVKELMINCKIPAELRAYWPIVAMAAHPVWIPGLHLDHRAQLKADGPAVYLRCD
jgi:tRNA(Ile)-lysidine synthase